MKHATTRWIAFGLMLVMAAVAVSPAAMADSRQKNKNNWRNLGYAGAAVAGYGLLKHNTTATVLGAAAGGYGAYRYEKDRHSQSVTNSNRNRRYHRRYAARHHRHAVKSRGHGRGHR